MISEKKKGLYPKYVTKSGVSPQKTLIWISICAPEAPSLLISSGHSPRLGGHNFRLGGAQAVNWGGTAPVCPPVVPSLLRTLTFLALNATSMLLCHQPPPQKIPACALPPSANKSLLQQ